MNTKNLSRRDFVRLAGMGSAASLIGPSLAFTEEFAKKSPIGSTFILWGYNADALEPALRDMSKLGYHAFETFGHVIEAYEKDRGGMRELMSKYNIPMISAFCNTDVINPSNRKAELEKLIKWCQLTKQHGGKLIEYCPSGIKREGYDYREHKKNLVESMNEYAKAVTDQGLVCALHPHTGTPIETEEEVYFIMENLDTRYMKFGPDVGQLEKGGADPVKIVKDFMPLIEHVHLKDYSGGEGYLGYAPLGEGKVKLKEILKMLEVRRNKMAGMIMFELDSDKKTKTPLTEFEAAKVSHDYLRKLGYKFKDRS
jgi:inosose dehydratase